MIPPEFCPNPDCALADPARAALVRPRFFNHCGSYKSRIFGRPTIPRFRCRRCKRTFSHRTFCGTYRQKKPELNPRIWQCFSSGVSRRQTARLVGASRGTVERRFVLFAAQSRLLHEQTLSTASLPQSCLHVQFDEMESFVQDRFHPVSLPVMVLEENYFIVDSRVASIRRKGVLTAGQKKKLEKIEEKEGRRENRSIPELEAMLAALRTFAIPEKKGQSPPFVSLKSDEKTVYPRLIGTVLAPTLRYRHLSFSGKIKRDARNPLFPINHTNAEHRYHVAMLLRRSWCHAKTEAGLSRHLAIYRVYRNFRRWVTNAKKFTPAMALGLAKDRLDHPQLFRYDRRFTIAQLRALGAVAVGA